MRIYLGYDGSYVLSRHPLIRRKANEPGSVDFLSTKAKQQPSIVDLQPEEGALLFKALKLGTYEVVELEVTIKARRQR